MKAIELLKATMRDNLFFTGSSAKVTVVCGSLEPNRWYYKDATPSWGKASCVIWGSEKQPMYLYLIEE
jgi:hypothetical protein